MNYTENIFEFDGGKMNYAVYTPMEKGDYPLLVYLHGAGERGLNISHLTRHGIPKLLSEGKEFPAVIVTPQCPADRVWDNMVVQVKAIIDIVVSEYEIKKDRICITGSSMGGFGTWMMGLTYPDFFSAIGPVAGGGMSWRTTKLKNTPVFAVHGDKDSCVPYIYSQLMVDGVNRNGGKAVLKAAEGCEHNDGIDYAYRSTELVEWLLSQRRTDFTPIEEPFAHLF
ncbi:MAG: prolyl oligopeptidase family serine peptidase [Acutalibacteraceae bacterium]|nr:prolyl oligopeptidase family serine peptidase [Acutalibacteraceae bacterium]